MMKRSISILAVVIAVFELNPVQADVVTIGVGGVVDFIMDPSPDPSLNVGDDFFCTYSFESTAVDYDADPSVGLYGDALLSVSGHVGGLSFGGSLDGEVIQVLNDSGSPPEDSYDVIGIIDFLGYSTILNIYLEDSTASALSSDAMLLTPPNIDDFDVHWIDFCPEGSGSISGDITYIVPEPGSLFLLLTVTGPILLRKR